MNQGWENPVFFQKNPTHLLFIVFFLEKPIFLYFVEKTSFCSFYKENGKTLAYS